MIVIRNRMWPIEWHHYRWPWRWLALWNHRHNLGNVVCIICDIMFTHESEKTRGL